MKRLLTLICALTLALWGCSPALARAQDPATTYHIPYGIEMDITFIPCDPEHIGIYILPDKLKDADRSDISLQLEMLEFLPYAPTEEIAQMLKGRIHFDGNEMREYLHHVDYRGFVDVLKYASVMFIPIDQYDSASLQVSVGPTGACDDFLTLTDEDLLACKEDSDIIKHSDNEWSFKQVDRDTLAIIPCSGGKWLRCFDPLEDYEFSHVMYTTVIHGIRTDIQFTVWEGEKLSEILPMCDEIVSSIVFNPISPTPDVTAEPTPDAVPDAEASAAPDA